MDEKLRLVFAVVFGDEVAAGITQDSTMDDVDAWDSLSFINVMMEIERRYEISISPDEAVYLTGVGKIQELLAKKGTLQGR